MKNRIVLITGGASGIGKAMVRMFADRGCQVIIFDVQDDKGEVLAKELCDQRKKVVYKHVNLFDIDEENQRFNSELSPQVIYILVENMAVVWLKTQRDSEENTKNMLSEKDYSVFSPANLLTSLRKAYTEADKEIIGIMNDYSLDDLDTKKLMNEVLYNE